MVPCPFRSASICLLTISYISVLLFIGFGSGSLLLNLDLQSVPSSNNLGPLSSFGLNFNYAVKSTSYQLSQTAVGPRPVLIVIERSPWRYFSRVVTHFILSTASVSSPLVEGESTVSLMVSTIDEAYFAELQDVFPNITLRVLAKPTASQESLKAYVLAHPAGWQEEAYSQTSLFVDSFFSLFGIQPTVSLFSTSPQHLAATLPSLSSDFVDCATHYVEYTMDGIQAGLEGSIPETCRRMFGVRPATLEPTPWSESCDRILNVTSLLLKSAQMSAKSCNVHSQHMQIKHRVHPYSIGPSPRAANRINFNQSNHLMQKDTTSITGVTLATHLTVDRLPGLEAIAARWYGPISAVIYASAPQAIRMLAFFANSTVLRQHKELYVHVVTPCGSFYPVNVLRNVAMRYAVTDHVFVLDVDFTPSRDCYPILRRMFGSLDAPGYVMSDAIGPVAHVVPAFETFVGDPEAEQRSESECELGRCSAAPLGKKQLFHLYQAGKIAGFHIRNFPFGHGPTNYRRFFNTSEDYEIEYRRLFEPYVVVDRRRAPMANENMTGWGQDKTTFMLALHNAGFRFVVIARGAFLLHQEDTRAGTVDVAWLKSKLYTNKCNKRISLKIPMRGDTLDPVLSDPRTNTSANVTLPSDQSKASLDTLDPVLSDPHTNNTSANVTLPSDQDKPSLLSRHQSKLPASMMDSNSSFPTGQEPLSPQHVPSPS